eukprot:scpid72715/ scgid11618/ 
MLGFIIPRCRDEEISVAQHSAIVSTGQNPVSVSPTTMTTGSAWGYRVSHGHCMSDAPSGQHAASNRRGRSTVGTPRRAFPVSARTSDSKVETKTCLCGAQPFHLQGLNCRTCKWTVSSCLIKLQHIDVQLRVHDV